MRHTFVPTSAMKASALVGNAALSISLLTSPSARGQLSCPKVQDGNFSVDTHQSSNFSGGPLGLRVDYCTAPIPDGEELRDLMPDDKVWASADAPAPVFTTKHNVRIGNLLVPAGSYSLYFLPSQSGWKLVVNKGTGQPAKSYDESQNLGIVNMMSEPVPDRPFDNLTIRFGASHEKSCSGRCDPKNGPYTPASEIRPAQLHFQWGNVDVYAGVGASPGAEEEQIRGVQ